MSTPEQSPEQPDVNGLDHLVTLAVYRAPDDDPAAAKVTIEKAPWMSLLTARDLLGQALEELDRTINGA